uniref:Ig-like domain-containing protein n=1 Tax=Callorhinchus milii TaxID=7868 RepID=A0A4W3HLZ6_CALMI
IQPRRWLFGPSCLCRLFKKSCPNQPYSPAFTVSGPALPVPAIAGSDVVLDCKCSTDLPREGVEVRWFRTRYESPVYLYSEGRDHLGKQDEAYRHRTILFVEEFINGNVSLRLEDVRVSDNGEYTCLVSYARWHEEALIELKVIGHCVYKHYLLMLCSKYNTLYKQDILYILLCCCVYPVDGSQHQRFCGLMIREIT